MYLWCGGVGEHAAQGHRKQTSGKTPGGTLSKSQDRGWGGVGRWGVQQPWWDLNRGWVELGGGTEEEQASRWRRRACFVPVSIADEVTKTILNSPKALTASCDRCYCPRQSNTTVWIRRKNKKPQEESIEKIHKAASRSRKTPGRGGSVVEVQAREGRRELRFGPNTFIVSTSANLVNFFKSQFLAHHKVFVTNAQDQNLFISSRCPSFVFILLTMFQSSDQSWYRQTATRKKLVIGVWRQRLSNIKTLMMLSSFCWVRAYCPYTVCMFSVVVYKNFAWLSIKTLSKWV